nr:DUF6085 family protein [Micromonospora sp. DSM 115978]
MTPAEIRDAATAIARAALADIDMLGVFEMHPDVTDADAEQIHDMARAAHVVAEPAGAPHIISFRPTGWTIQHPMACRARGDLFDCQLNRVAETELTEPPAGLLGQFEITLSDLGDRLLIGDPVDGWAAT